MQQFGADYGHMGTFKRKFGVALRQVTARYQAARVELDGQGLRLFNSAPPVTKRVFLLPPKSGILELDLSTVTWTQLSSNH